MLSALKANSRVLSPKKLFQQAFHPERESRRVFFASKVAPLQRVAIKNEMNKDESLTLGERKYLRNGVDAHAITVSSQRY